MTDSAPVQNTRAAIAAPGSQSEPHSLPQADTQQHSQQRHAAHSPFLHSGNRSERWLNQQLLALLPGSLLSLWFFGPGVAINIAITMTVSVLADKLLGGIKPTHRTRLDRNLLIMAIVLGLAIPPDTSIVLPIIGALVMVALGKHVWGGTGQYPFHPAMVAYLALLLLFTEQLQAWPVATGLLQFDWSTLADKLLLPGARPLADGLSQATPLVRLHEQFDLTTSQNLLIAAGDLITAAGLPWLLISFGFLSGGLYLCYCRAIDWHTPAATLATLLLCCFLSTGFLSLPAKLLGLHYFAGHLLLVSFWVTTEFSSSASTTRGRILFGVVFGGSVFLIRHGGSVIDGLASAVIIANLMVPLLDRNVRVTPPTSNTRADDT